MVGVNFITYNVLHKTSKGMREMNYQNTQQFERATMLKLPIQPLLVLCGVMTRFYFFDFQYLKNYFTIKLKIIAFLFGYYNYSVYICRVIK
jgi:hypothetical protein